MAARANAAALTNEIEGGRRSGEIGEVGEGVGGGEASCGVLARDDVEGGSPTGDKVRKVICLNAQSTNGLCRVSQFNPSTIGLVVPSGVTKNVNGVTLPQAKRSGSRTSCVMTALDEPSIITSFFGGVGSSGIRCLAAQ